MRQVKKLYLVAAVLKQGDDILRLTDSRFGNEGLTVVDGDAGDGRLRLSYGENTRNELLFAVVCPGSGVFIIEIYLGGA